MFTGREYDYETGNYYYRARYYSPRIGRFMQTDPIGNFDSDSHNLYTYVQNNPIGSVDPKGLYTIDISCYKTTDPFFDEIAIDQAMKDVRNKVMNTNCIYSQALKDALLNKLKTVTVKCLSKSKKYPNICGRTKAEANYIEITRRALNPNRCGPLGSSILHELIHTTQRKGKTNEKVPEACEASCYSNFTKKTTCITDCK